MKHLQPVASPLATEDDLKAILVAQLDAVGRYVLAQRLGITPVRLAHILRGTHAVPDNVAAALGFRKVARFERMS